MQQGHLGEMLHVAVCTSFCSFAAHTFEDPAFLKMYPFKHVYHVSHAGGMTVFLQVECNVIEQDKGRQ